jgi:hypothetical protein
MAEMAQAAIQEAPPMPIDNKPKIAFQYLSDLGSDLP